MDMATTIVTSLPGITSSRTTGKFFFHAVVFSSDTNSCRTVNLFCALDAKSQLTIRHRSSAVYSKAFVQSSAHVRRLFSILQTRTLSVLAARAASGEPLDVLSHYVAFSMDFVSSFHFGLSRSTDFLQDVKARDQWLQAYDSAYGKALYWRQEHPFLVSIMRRIGVPLIPESYYRHVEDFDAWVIPRVNTTEGYLDRSGTGEANTHPEEFPLSTIKSERRCYLSDGPSRMQILLYPSNKY